MPPSGTVTWELVPVAEVDREELWALYQRHFDADRRCLEHTLGLAQVVACFRDRDSRELRGMAAFSVREVACEGRRVYRFWSGGLAMDRACRGQWLFERAALWTILQFRLAHPFAPLYAAFVSISFQSFRLAARNLETYWSHPERPTPGAEQAVLDQLCGELDWDAARRVTRATRSVRPESRRTATAPTDPLRRYFDRINPHADRGEGVVLIAPLDAANLLHVFTAALGRRVAEWSLPVARAHRLPVA